MSSQQKVKYAATNTRARGNGDPKTFAATNCILFGARSLLDFYHM